MVVNTVAVCFLFFQLRPVKVAAVCLVWPVVGSTLSNLLSIIEYRLAFCGNLECCCHFHQVISFFFTDFALVYKFILQSVLVMAAQKASHDSGVVDRTVSLLQ